MPEFPLPEIFPEKKMNRVYPAGRKRSHWLALTLFAGMALTAAVKAQSLPTGGQIVSGTGAIGTPQDGTLAVEQSSSRLAIDWQQFNIGAGNTVRFMQPTADSVALNRVLGQDPSQILGQLQANGQVFLVNPNGILFGQDANVNVGALVASTLDIAPADFMAGNYQFRSRDPNGIAAAVLNRGTITAADGGAVALLGGQVQNQGVIQARLGTVALAAGSAATLDFAGDGLLKVQIDAAAKDALAENGNLIQADGGQVLMTAHASDALLKTVVNNTGVIEARTLENRAGKIVLLGDLSGGTVQVGGTLDASAPDGGDGGFIETSGNVVQIDEGVSIFTLAPNGKTGTWLIDPRDFTIDSGDDGCVDPGCTRISASLLGTMLDGTNVVIATADAGDEPGNIYVNAAVSWNSVHTLSLNAHNDINVSESITASGGGGLALKAGRDVLVNELVNIQGDKAALLVEAGRHIEVNSEIRVAAQESDEAVVSFEAGQGSEGGGNITIDAPIYVTGPSALLDLNAEGEILVRDEVRITGSRSEIHMGGSHINVGNASRNARVHIEGDEASISLTACGADCGTVIVNDEVSIRGNEGTIIIGAQGGIYTAGKISIDGDGLIGLAGGLIDTAQGSVVEVRGEGSSAISLLACGFADCSDVQRGDAPIDPGTDPDLRAGDLVLGGALSMDSAGGASVLLLGANVFVEETAEINLAGDSVGLLVTACGYSSCLDVGDPIDEVFDNSAALAASHNGTLAIAGNVSMTAGQTSALFVGNAMQLDASLAVQSDEAGAVLFAADKLQINGAVDVSGQTGLIQAFANDMQVNNALTLDGTGGVTLSGSSLIVNDTVMARGDDVIISLSVCNCVGDDGGLEINGDIVAQSDNGAIDISSDRNILLNGRLSAEEIALVAEGDVVSTAGSGITATRLNVASVDGSVSLDKGAHSVAAMHAFANGDIAFSNNGDLALGQAWISGDGNIAIRSTGTLALIEVLDHDGDPLSGTGTFRIDGKGDIDLVAAESFINTFGANVFDINQGNWRIWSNEPASDWLDGLTYDFKQYDAIYGSVVLGEGNGVLYAFSPVLDVRLKGDISKVYDGTNRASVSVDNFELHGVQQGDHVLLSGGTGRYSDPNAGQAKTVTVEGLQWAAHEVAGGAKVYGYRLNTPVGDIGVIHPREITVAADDLRKYMGQSDPALTWRLIDGQLVGTDQLTGLLNRDAGELPGSYAIRRGTLTAGGNYALSFVEGQLVVLDPADEFSQLGGPYRAAVFSAHNTPQGPAAFDKDYDDASSAGSSIYLIENGGLRMPEEI